MSEFCDSPRPNQPTPAGFSSSKMRMGGCIINGPVKSGLTRSPSYDFKFFLSHTHTHTRKVVSGLPFL